MSGGPKTQRAEAAIQALLTAASMPEAAATVGVSTRTLRRWLADPAFKRQVVDAKRDLVHRAITRAQQAVLRAVEVQTAILEDPDAPASARLKAAGTLIELAFKGLEAEDFDARLSALEQGPQEGA